MTCAGTKVALLSAALFLLVAACGEQAPEETQQGAAPASEQSTAAATGDAGQATEGEQQQ
ncbi:MAG: hypothetical protein ACREJ5_07165 [Geminicoccaceae bacterium]